MIIDYQAIAKQLRDAHADGQDEWEFTDGNMLDAIFDLVKNETHKDLTSQEKLKVLDLLLEMR